MYVGARTFLIGSMAAPGSFIFIVAGRAAIAASAAVLAVCTAPKIEKSKRFLKLTQHKRQGATKA